MHYYLSTWWRRLRRCGYCRGFGVQSPSAYAFIRYVINEHYPYYAYQELKERLVHLDRRQHKLGRLLLRLANFWQPEISICNDSLFEDYLLAGCRKVKWVELEHPIQTDYLLLKDNLLLNEAWGKKRMMVINLEKMGMKEVRTQVLPLCDDQTMLVLLGNLYREKRGEEWLHLQESDYCGITYDLYSLGIIFFDKKKFKQHYRMNF
jgi:hypothetical protein